MAKAQFAVLGRLYGTATDVTVTGPNEHQPNTPIPIRPGPHGAEYCTGALPRGQVRVGSHAAAAKGSGKCIKAAGMTFTSWDPLSSGFSLSKVAAAARLPAVAAAPAGSCYRRP